MYLLQYVRFVPMTRCRAADQTVKKQNSTIPLPLA